MLTPDVLCQLVVSVQPPDASLLGAQVRHLVHVDQQHVGVPADPEGEGEEDDASSPAQVREGRRQAQHLGTAGVEGSSSSSGSGVREMKVE